MEKLNLLNVEIEGIPTSGRTLFKITRKGEPTEGFPNLTDRELIREYLSRHMRLFEVIVAGKCIYCGSKKNNNTVCKSCGSGPVI